MSPQFSVPGPAQVVDDDPTLELPVVVVPPATTGRPPGDVRQPRRRVDAWLAGATYRADLLRQQGRYRAGVAARTVGVGVWALVLWTLGTALAAVGWALGLLRRVAPVAVVVAVLVIGVRALPWDAAGRLVRSVGAAVTPAASDRSEAPAGATARPTSEPPTTEGFSDWEDSTDAVPSPSATYPALVPYDADLGTATSLGFGQRVRIVRPGA